MESGGGSEPDRPEEPGFKRASTDELSSRFDRQGSTESQRSLRCNELKSRPSVSLNRALMRAASAKAVLFCFARVFAPQEATVTKAVTASMHGEVQELLEGDHKAADEAFYSAPEVDHVSVFVSHSWSAPRWQKALALYYYVNIQLAVICALLTWLGLMAAMVCLHGPTGMGGNSMLLPLFVGVPMAIFFLVFFCGHHIWTPVANLWLDRLCIHQTRADLMLAGINALPEIVTGSGRMLILWSGDYFERIWCNAEVATFFAANEGADKIDFLPLWLVPWLLSAMTLDILSVFIANKLFVLIPEAGEFFGTHLPACHSWIISFLAQFTGIGIAFWLAYLCVAVPTWHSLHTKLDTHDGMMRQCQWYSILNAKCSVESDRPVVENLISELFDDADDPLQAFDRFMYRDLAAHIATRIGRPAHLPYRICLLVSLPLTFSAAANVWGCDDMPCAIAAEAELGPGATVAQQMVTNFLAWAVGIFGIYPTVCPVTLYLMSRCRTCCGRRKYLQGLLNFLLIVVGYAYMAFHEGFAAGIINTASAQGARGAAYAVPWCIAVLVYLALLVWWNVQLFRSGEAHRLTDHI